MAGYRNVAALLDGFNAAYDTTGRVMRDFDLAKIATAKVKEIPGQPEAIPGQRNIQSEIDNDPAVAAAQPSAAPAFEYLGKTSATAPDDATKTRGRQLAMADVFEKYGEVERGMGMRREVRRDSIEAEALDVSRKRMGWEEQDRARKQELQRREDAYTTDRQEAFNNSTFGQRNAQYAKAMDKYVAEKSAYDAAVEAGKPPPIAPTAPARPQVSWGESLLDHATLLANDIKHGKAGNQDMLKFAELQKQLTDEGYTKTMTMAQAGAPLTQVIAAFNANGEQKIDPAAIISDKMVDRGSGVKSRIVTFKGTDGAVHTIDTLAELDALGKADKVFTRAFAANADRRGANADARGAASLGLQQQAAERDQAKFDSEEPARKLSKTIADLQVERLQPGTTPERRTEIDKLLTPSGTDKDAPATVKLANAALKAGMHPDMASALRWAHENGDKSPTALRADIYKAALTANMGDAKRAQATTEEAMKYLNVAPPAAAPAAGGGAAGVPAPAQRKVGQTYQTPRGPLKWDGTGWVQPQP